MSGAPTTEGKAVQVVVRLRPFNDKEQRGSTLPVITASMDRSEVCICRGQGSRQVKQSFSFDRVFTSFTSQAEVFNQTFVEQGIIDDVLRGFESTVFAYGQTGTGKTFTMEGDLLSEDLRGVIPRATAEIFDRLQRTEWFEVKASYLEIYCEELCDLLLPADPHAAVGPDGASRLSIMEDKTKRGRGVFCHGLSEVAVRDEREVLDLIQRAAERRRVGETKMNARSSRSHCIFTLSVHSKSRLEDGAVIESSGKLHLVDLAGSECAKACGGSDLARERERKNINQSLLTLGRVIGTLREGSVAAGQHVPYRDSKLTRLLQESLGGRCKTCIIATLSPSALAADESLSTLQYAQMAMGITNKPVAMSYLKITGASEGSAADGAGGTKAGASIEEWSRMEMRLAYMESQVAEAQAALARKHAALSAVEARADAAEARERATSEELEGARADLEAVRAERDRAAADRDDARSERDRRGVLLDATRRTEAALTAEARSLLDALEKSLAACDGLEADLAKQAAEEEGHRDKVRAFARDADAALRALQDGARAHAAAVGDTAREGVATLQGGAKKATDAARDAAEGVRGAAKAVRASEHARAAMVASAADSAAQAHEAERAAAATARAEASAALDGRLDVASTNIDAADAAFKERERAVDQWKGAFDAALENAADTFEKLLGAHADTAAAAALAHAEAVGALGGKLREHRDALGHHGDALRALFDDQESAVAAMKERRAARAGVASRRAETVATHARAAEGALADYAGNRRDGAARLAIAAAEAGLRAAEDSLGAALGVACHDLDAASEAAGEADAEAQVTSVLADNAEADAAATEAARAALAKQTADLEKSSAVLADWLAGAQAREEAALAAVMDTVRAAASQQLAALHADAHKQVEAARTAARAVVVAVGETAEDLSDRANGRAQQADAIGAVVRRWGDGHRAAAAALSRGERAVRDARGEAASALAAVTKSHADADGAVSASAEAADAVHAAVSESVSTLRHASAEDALADAACDAAEAEGEKAAREANARLSNLANEGVEALGAAVHTATSDTVALGDTLAGSADADADARKDLAAHVRAADAAARQAVAHVRDAGTEPARASEEASGRARRELDAAREGTRAVADAVAAADVARDSDEERRWAAVVAAQADAGLALEEDLAARVAGVEGKLEETEAAVAGARAGGESALAGCAKDATTHADAAASSVGALSDMVQTHASDNCRADEAVPPPRRAERPPYSTSLTCTPPEELVLSAAMGDGGAGGDGAVANSSRVSSAHTATDKVGAPAPAPPPADLRVERSSSGKSARSGDSAPSSFSADAALAETTASGADTVTSTPASTPSTTGASENMPPNTLPASPKAGRKPEGRFPRGHAPSQQSSQIQSKIPSFPKSRLPLKTGQAPARP